MKKFSNWFKTASPMVQVVIVVVAIVVVWYLFHRVKGFMKATKNNAENQGQLTVLESKGITATFNSSEYEQMASQLYEAMKSTWYLPGSWGTNENAIYSIFGRLKNEVDFLKLQSAFGIKGGYGLIYWLQDELDDTEKSELNQLLASKGITKRI